MPLQRDANSVVLLTVGGWRLLSGDGAVAWSLPSPVTLALLE
jgi:hypothetical protein